MSKISHIQSIANKLKGRSSTDFPPSKDCREIKLTAQTKIINSRSDLGKSRSFRTAYKIPFSLSFVKNI